MKYIRNDKENLIGIVLVCLWIIITNPKKPEEKKKSIIGKILDNLALIVIVMFMGEDGLYLHYIT